MNTEFDSALTSFRTTAIAAIGPIEHEDRKARTSYLKPSLIEAPSS